MSCDFRDLRVPSGLLPYACYKVCVTCMALPNHISTIPHLVVFVKYLVCVKGFEPSTSRSQTERSVLAELHTDIQLWWVLRDSHPLSEFIRFLRFTKPPNTYISRSSSLWPCNREWSFLFITSKFSSRLSHLFPFL